MRQFKFLEKYQTLIAKRLTALQTPLAKWLRIREMQTARGDVPRLAHIEALTDEELVRKWMWLTTIVGGPICFIVVPFALSLVTSFVPHFFLEILWDVDRIVMALIFGLFLLLAYVTLRQSHQ
jgi:hypothetical protein